MTTHMLLPAAERVWKPWKSGGGEMADIAVVPASAGYDDFKWRIAIARIEEDRPFSDFPDIDRTFMVVGGKGVRLAVDGMETARLDHKSPPFLFPGDKPTSVQLIDGPVQALNVMTRRGVADSRVGLADGPANFVAGDEAYAVLVWARGRADVTINGVVEKLELHDAIIFAAGAEVQIAPADHSHGWLVEVRTRPIPLPAA
jgi:uncharacterized protein